MKTRTERADKKVLRKANGCKKLTLIAFWTKGITKISSNPSAECELTEQRIWDQALYKKITKTKK